MTVRRARVANRSISLEEVQAYMPSNYRASVDRYGTITIEGKDVAGWTLDGYVIPRLGSGLITAVELTTPRYLVRIDDTTRTIRESEGATADDFEWAKGQAIEFSRQSTHRFYVWHVADFGGMSFIGMAARGEWYWR